MSKRIEPLALPAKGGPCQEPLRHAHLSLTAKPRVHPLSAQRRQQAGQPCTNRAAFSVDGKWVCALHARSLAFEILCAEEKP